MKKPLKKQEAELGAEYFYGLKKLSMGRVVERNGHHSSLDLVARFIKSHARSKDLVKLFSKPGHILSYDQLASRHKLGGERFKDFVS